MTKITLILLAAGSSSRLGQSKQLLEVDGEPLLRRISRIALSGGADKVIVVLGANAEAHQKIIDNLSLMTYVNPDWQKGMGNSLKAGLRYTLQIAPDTEAIILLVCDQPKLMQQHLVQLIQQYNSTKSKIVASSYSGTIGVPALFDKSLFPELLSLDDDQGAKTILKIHAASTSAVNFEGGEIDIDTLADYHSFIQKSSTS